VFLGISAHTILWRQAIAEERDKICREERDFKGSRFRCLLATQQPKPRVVAFLNSLVQPLAKVGEEDWYMPEGFCKPDEARLGKTNGFLTDEQREIVTNWWLAVRRNANTPNWDIVSTCTVGGRRGIVLVEAKGHAAELNPNDCCRVRNEQNRQRIATAIGQANHGLGEGWELSMDSRYQLSNRFAWAWRVASLGVPVALVYLGFLNADEMGQPFTGHGAWERCLLAYADGTVPRRVWTSGPIGVNGTPLIPLIRSADVNVATA
jgi:hypothetical protein